MFSSVLEIMVLRCNWFFRCGVIMMAVSKWSLIHLALGDRREREWGGGTERFKDKEERRCGGDSVFDISWQIASLNWKQNTTHWRPTLSYPSSYTHFLGILAQPLYIHRSCLFTWFGTDKHPPHFFPSPLFISLSLPPLPLKVSCC